MGWLSGWLYRRGITITEQSGSTLTDHQVKIELDSSNFDFSKANSDGSDIRFTEDDGTTLLSYWIEKWDSSNEEATIWVKVPSIPANSDVTIYLYYGNSEAESESDGEAVFEFFDDFEGPDIDTNKWSTIVGSVSVINGVVQLYVPASKNQKSAIESATTFAPPLIVESRAKVSAIVSHTGTKLCAITDNILYREAFSIQDATERIEVYDDTYTYINTVLDSTNYHVYSVVDDGTQVLFYQDYTYKGTIARTLSNKHVGFWVDTSSITTPPSSLTLYVDWVRVRKYAEQEPTASVGSEETALFTISGIVKLPDGTPVQGAKVISIREDTYEIIDTTTSGSDGSYTLNGFLYSGNTVIVIPSSSDQNGDIKCHIQPT